ncbi:MAG: monofunctional biosynthetic peptidoglycan transglycosylase [Bosea sp. (in: a-proteobacteria)]
MMRLLRFALAGLVALGLIWLALVIAHVVIAPSSTLMLGRGLTGQNVERRWVPLAAMSPELARAVIASEDQRFCQHWGVDFGALREVLNDEDGPSRGASTITMQVVKNLYLWPGRSYFRKALEIPMALMVDLVWSKRRVMEVYLNVAEWGDGVFGAEAAARRFFDKSASGLNAAEAARLAAALPNPRLADPRFGNGASRRIAQRMGRLGVLAECMPRG